MARTYSTALCSIWTDPAFVALSSTARDTFWMLFTQPETDAAGAAALTLRRWAKLVPAVEEGIGELSVAGFVVVDEDTEELLLVPFMESDGGYKHSKRVHAVLSALASIRSASIRQTAAKELARLGVSTGNVTPPDTHSVGYPKPVDSPTDVVTTYATREHPSSRIPQEGAAPADELIDTQDDESPFCPAHQPNGTLEPCGPCGTVKLRVARRQRERDAAAARAKSESLKLRQSCGHCDDLGFRLDDDGRPVGRCDHRPQLEVVVG